MSGKVPAREVEERLSSASPEHLSARSRTLWQQLVGDWDFEPHELVLLQLALEAVDRAEQARKLIGEQGLTIAGRYGWKANPAVAVERDARLAAARLFRQLQFEPPAPPPDPLALRRRRRA